MSPINKKNDTVLTLRSVTKSYDGQPVLSDLSLEFSSGTFYCLMAPSGNGKTTMFRLILGLEKPDSGVILFGTPTENPGNNDIKASSGTVSKSDPWQDPWDASPDLRCFSGKPSSGMLYRH